MRRGDTKEQLVVPQALQERVLEEAHDNRLVGHMGVSKTYERLRDRYWWYGMYTSVERCKDL